MSSVRTRWTRGAAAVVIVGLAAAGCANTLGAAAVVDGERITEAYLADTVADIRPFSDAAPATVLAALISGPQWLAAAEDAGFVVTDDDGRAVLETLAAERGLTVDGEAGPGLLTIARVTAAQDRANAAGQALEVSEAAQERASGIEIVVNPRYGEWVEDQGIQDIVRPWLTSSAVLEP